jgi:uncharacterized protein
MSYLDGGKVIDLMFGLPDPKGLHATYESFKPLYRDRESREFAFPAQYMFKDIPNIEAIGDDPVGWAVRQMDCFNIERALIEVNQFSDMHKIARDRFSDRFVFDAWLDPNGGMDEVRRLRQLTKKYDLNPVAEDWATPQIANTALQRYGHVSHIAGLVAFVAGPEADYITGASLTVDGGTNA